MALRAFSSRETVLSIGQQIGVGKESDIYLVHGTHHFENSNLSDNDNSIDSDNDKDKDFEDEELVKCVQVSPAEYQERVLKIQRLGRTSFRTVKTNRDYLQHRSSCSWLYLSRLAAGLEYRFMKALKGVGLPVPKPLDWSRHCVVMEFINGTLLEHVRLRNRHCNNDFEDDEISDQDKEEPEEQEGIQNKAIDYINEDDVPGLYTRLMELISELASYGLIHGDFNEFNLLLTRPSPSSNSQSPRVTPVIIDFPQMVSIDHQNAEYYFNRDVECIRTFFSKRFDFTNDSGLFEAVWDEVKRNEEKKLDVELKASGYIKPKRQPKLRSKCKIVESESENESESESNSNSSYNNNNTSSTNSLKLNYSDITSSDCED